MIKLNIFTPYRICLLGAHIDHQKGQALSIVIDKGIHLHCDYNLLAMMEAIDLNNEMYIVRDFDKTNHWSDYLKGSLSILSKYNLENYIKGEIYGDFPIGGLSSSAAVLISYIKAIDKVNNLNLTDKEIVQYAYLIEKNYIGLNIGMLDQLSIMYGKENHVLHYDFYKEQKELIPFKFDGEIMIIHSGLERCLTNSDYNNRVNECKTIVNKYNKKYNTSFSYLREIPDILNNLDLYNETEIKRINHFVSEIERVNKGMSLLNNVEEFGKLVNESCLSSINNYECGCEQLIYLYELLSNSQYVYGTRFNGAGFKGSLYALVKDRKASEVLNQYKNKYPQLNVKFDFVKSVDGAFYL